MDDVQQILQGEQVETIQMLGVRFHSLSVDSLFNIMADVIRSERRWIIANVNVNAMNLAYRLAWFRQFLNDAELVFCDGAGVMLGARILGRRVKERITYADWIWRLAEFAERHGFRLYLLGARPGVADRAAARLQARFPRLIIAGAHHGYFDRTPGSAEQEQVIRAINAARPHILILGFGMPMQERWLAQHWPALNAQIALTGGAVFDYASGELRRAPRWMTDHGLEWLGRLIIEPRRLWRRYIMGNPLFLLLVMGQRLGLIRGPQGD